MPSLISSAASAQAAKPIASMAKGGPVKKTGLYKLHSGEFVVKASMARKLGMGKK